MVFGMAISDRVRRAPFGLVMLVLLLAGCADTREPSALPSRQSTPATSVQSATGAPAPPPIVQPTIVGAPVAPAIGIGSPTPTGAPALVATPTATGTGNPTAPAITGQTVVSSPTPSTMMVTVYYPRIARNDVEFVPVERTVPRTVAVGRATLQELLKGPTAEEKARGLTNPIPEKAKLLSLRIVDGVAYADFDEALQFQVGGSLRVMAIRRMITLALLQFSTVQKVVISIDGRTEDILQP